MKSKLLKNRMGSIAMVLVMTFAMCVSPFAAMPVSAADLGYITERVTISPTVDTLKLEAPEDLSAYFTMYLDGKDLPCVYSYSTKLYYSDMYTEEDPETYHPFSELFTLTYYAVDEEGNISEDAIEEPVSAGTYAVCASTSETYSVYADDNWEDYGYILALTSTPLIYTIAGGAEQPSDGVVQFKAVNGTDLTFEEGAQIDLTEDFVLYWNDDPLTFMQDRNYTCYYAKAAAETYLYGDVNLDGFVKAGDALAILKNVVGLTSLGETGSLPRILANMNGDDDITADDALCVLRTVVGLDEEKIYTAEPEELPEGALTMEDAYTVSYYDADGKELADAPTKAGTYTAKAALTSSDVYYWTGLYNWCRSENVTSDVITLTIGDGADETGAVIKFTGDTQTFAEDDEMDLSDSFSVYYGGAKIYALYVYETETYYYAEYSPLFGELLVLNYYDNEGNKLEAAPAEAGVYSVSASFPEGNIYAYADAENGIGYISPAESERYKLTITGTGSSGQETTDEPLLIEFIGDTTEFTANGDPVDFSDAFTFSMMGVEPVIIFQGYVYVDENNNPNWIWGTGTDKDYVNYSNAFAEDGYTPFSELYVVHYWDADGNELESAPSEPGSYFVSADIPKLSEDGRRCIYIKYGYDETQGITEDEHYYYYGTAESEKIAFTITAP